MHRLMESCYDSVPPLLQTAALNAYGLITRRRRAEARRVAESLAASEHWSRDEQIAYVGSRLRAILAHAVRSVPRYREMKYLELELRDGRTDVFALLNEFPVVTRAEIVEEAADFLSTAFSQRELRATKTSGTTGTPMKTWVEPWVERVNDGLVMRRDMWAGYRDGDWVARLVGDPVVPRKTADMRVPYRVSWTDRRLYLSTYHLSLRTAREFARLLEARRPEFLMGYPSALEALANGAGRGCVGWQPKAVLYSSEPFYEHQQAAILHYVSSPIRGFYGCAERVVSAAQCERGTYHLSLVDGYVEGQFPGMGDESLGWAATTPVTTLLNRAMPLIRYMLGDTLRVMPDERCQCGRTLPVLAPVLTKLEDSLTTPSGRVVSPSILTWAFKDLSGVRRSQIIQTGASTIEVRVVVEEEFLNDVQRILVERIGSMVFGEMTVSVKRVQKLQLTANGKTRFVINEHVNGRGSQEALNHRG